MADPGAPAPPPGAPQQPGAMPSYLARAYQQYYGQIPPAGYVPTQALPPGFVDQVTPRRPPGRSQLGPAFVCLLASGATALGIFFPWVSAYGTEAGINDVSSLDVRNTVTVFLVAISVISGFGAVSGFFQVFGRTLSLGLAGIGVLWGLLVFHWTTQVTNLSQLNIQLGTGLIAIDAGAALILLGSIWGYSSNRPPRHGPLV